MEPILIKDKIMKRLITIILLTFSIPAFSQLIMAPKAIGIYVSVNHHYLVLNDNKLNKTQRDMVEVLPDSTFKITGDTVILMKMVLKGMAEMIDASNTDRYKQRIKMLAINKPDEYFIWVNEAKLYKRFIELYYK